MRIRPDFAEAHNNLGSVLHLTGRIDEAIPCFNRALQLAPAFVEALSNLGNAYRLVGNYDGAVQRLNRAIELAPRELNTWSDMANCLIDLRRFAEAGESFQHALALDPNHADTHLNQALFWLLLGDFERGWPEYEWRWGRPQSPPRPFVEPLWRGEDIAGKTLLLHAEQGYGDTLQFVRYLPWVKRTGAIVALECQRPLLWLLQGLPEVDRLLGSGDELPPFDVHLPMASLPGVFHTNLQNIPGAVPYLYAPRLHVEKWRRRLAEIDGFKVGIAWQGNPNQLRDRSRSIPLRWFERLTEVPGVRLVSLQKGFGAEQLARRAGGIPIEDLSDELHDFADTAGAMMNLDLVITCDSVAAHLAGAMALNVWVALSPAADWRYTLDPGSTPWYPTMRLFRQSSPGDWEGVFQRIEDALRQLVARKRDGMPV